VRRLLLVEDDSSLGETLHERLEKEGYAVEWCETLGSAEKAAENVNFDLIILDVNLPDGSGFDFARAVREQKKATPFIFVTAMNSAEHRLEGYEIGAEEYVPKPFHLKELLLRIRHVLDTHPSEALTVLGVVNERLQVGERTIDFNARAVVGADSAQEFLQTRDFELLRFLIDSAPRVLSRDEILDVIWGEDKFPSTRTVDNAIVRLRQSLQDSEASLIRSVRGVGYQWLGPNFKK
jgi:DNA-binding response OmpR family regulator